MTTSNAQQNHDLFRKANDPEASATSLIELSKSESEIIRGAVALNKSTPKFVLNKLMEDPSEHVMDSLKKAGLRSSPNFRKIYKVTGNNLIFRDANLNDAEFILGLRLDASKGKYLSNTSPELSRQISWLEQYKIDDSQIYFIITDRNNISVGTVRIYDKQGDSFCWGSWILKAGTPSNYALESALMVYRVALRLGFNKAHFDVRKGNTSVWRFHERFGAKKLQETHEDYIYSISFEEIHKSLYKYKKYLPDGIEIFDYDE